MKYFVVIMPISLDDMFSQKAMAIKDIAKKNGLEAYLPIETEKESSLACILSNIKKASFVIADLSYERPSCYYELGLAQAMGKPTFLIALAGTKVHQAYGDIHFYEEIEQYRQLIENIIR